MKILITGGGGFLGRKLAAALLTRGRLADRRGALSEIEELVLFDASSDNPPKDPRVRTVTGSVCEESALAAALSDDIDSVFHLAAVVSGEAEADFDKGMTVNLGGTLAVLNTCRRLRHAPRVVFTSSVAAFGGDLPDAVTDTTAPTPQSSYGAQKVIGELLVNDYSRKGFIDGRVLRLPTVCVRPGAPNKAASGFASAMVREPLDGVATCCPVPPTTLMWVMSPRTAVANLVYGHDLPAAAFGYQRVVNLPGLTVSADEMLTAVRSVCGDAVADLVEWRRDPAVQAVVATWPGRFESARAKALGFSTDPDFESVVREYLQEVGRRA